MDRRTDKSAAPPRFIEYEIPGLMKRFQELNCSVRAVQTHDGTFEKYGPSDCARREGWCGCTINGVRGGIDDVLVVHVKGEKQIRKIQSLDFQVVALACPGP